MDRYRIDEDGAFRTEGTIPQRNLRDGIAARLRRMLFDGELRPGQKLNQDAIAAEFGVSKLPVREALLVLGEEGLVDIKPRRGAFIAKLTPTDIQTHFEIIGAIARLTARRSAAAIGQKTLGELWQVHRAMLDERDPTVLTRLNYDFHRLINQECGSRRLIAQIEFLSKSIPPEFFGTPGWPEKAVHEHEQILRALEEGDVDTAGDLMDSHLRSSGEHAVRRLMNVGFFAEEPVADAV